MSINYFGQKIPTDLAQKFAPGIISQENRWEGNANFSPDGKEFYFNVFSDTFKTKAIYWSRYIEGVWSEPEKLEVLGDFGNWEPFISYSGKELFFVSARPPGSEVWNGRIWRTIKNGENTWLEPEMIDLGYETENGFWFPNHSRKNDNILYFGGNIEGIGTTGKGDLYSYNRSENQVTNIKELSSPQEDWDPFIAPDESYLMWASDRPGGYGGTDIYISFQSGDGWSEPVNLGKRVNSEKYEVAPRVSSDGKVLFFDRPDSGTQDIYWISSSILEDFRP